MFALMGGAVLFAGISKSGFGSKVDFIGVVILAGLMDPGKAIGVMLPLLMVMDLSNLRAYWGKWSRGDALTLILGGIPGVMLGALFFTQVNQQVLQFLIGLISLLFLSWFCASRLSTVLSRMGPFSRGVGGLAGFVAGFTSFVSHAGGPAAAVYLLSKNMSKTEYQASTVLVFWVINIVKGGLYAGLGLLSRDTLALDLVLLPFALCGVWLGLQAHRKIPEKAFFVLMYVALAVSALRLIWLSLA